MSGGHLSERTRRGGLASDFRDSGMKVQWTFKRTNPPSAGWLASDFRDSGMEVRYERREVSRK